MSNISIILDHYFKSKYTHALNLINDTILAEKIQKCFILIEKSQTYKAKKIADELLNQISTVNDIDLKFGINVAYARSIGYEGISDWKKSLEYLKKAENEYKELKPLKNKMVNSWYIELLIEKGVLSNIKDNDKNLSKSIYEKTLKLCSDIGDFRGQTKSFNFDSYNFISEQDFQSAINLLNSSLELSEKYEMRSKKSHTLCIFGFLYLQKGDLVDSGNFFSESLKICEEINNNWIRGNSLIGRGIVNIMEGDMIQAKQNLSEGIKVGQQLGDKHIEALSRMHLSQVFTHFGQIEAGLDELTKSSQINEFLADVNCYIDVNLRLGQAYSVIGQFSKAHDYFLNSYKIRGEIKEGSNLPKSLYYFNDSIYYLILSCIQFGKFNEAKEYISVFELYQKLFNNNRVNTQYQISNAYLKKHNTRIKIKIEAQNTFENLSNQPTIDYELKIFVLLNYCELLLDEFQTYGEIEALNELEQKFNALNIIVNKNKSISVLTELKLINSRLFLIKGDLNGAMRFLDEAKDIGKKNNLINIIERAVSQKQDIEDNLEKWQLLIESNVSLNERIKESKFKDYIVNLYKLKQLELK